MIRDEINSTLAKQMAAKLDGEIEGALNGFWPAWSRDDVKRRCHLVSRAGSPIQTLYADGIPILEIHPIQIETVKTETGWTLQATQNYRRLHSRADQ